MSPKVKELAKCICKYNKVEFKESIDSNTSYIVRIDCDILNVRSGSWSNYDKAILYNKNIVRNVKYKWL